MTQLEKALHVVRNPYGMETQDVKKATLFICDEVERLTKKVEDLEDVIDTYKNVIRRG